MDFPQKYVIVIRADSTDEAVEEALHFSYLFLMRALNEHRARGRNGDYELFAMELLTMLQRNRGLYTTPP
jgi:hypothetical protein